MMSLSYRNAVMWSLLGLTVLILALVFGPLPALAVNDWDDFDDGQNDAARYDTNWKNPDAVLYEVTEDMYLRDAAGNFVTSPVAGGSRSAVAQLTGWAKVGTPLCPLWVLSINPMLKQCTLNANGADNLSLATGKGTVSGTFAVVVQGDNTTDAAEFVIMTGKFNGAADLSKAFARVAPLGYITSGVGTIDQSDATFAFTATFRLPFSIDTVGRSHPARRSSAAFYMGDDGKPFPVKKNEKSIGFPAVRLELAF
jgi:hypothetical protein